MFQYRLAKFMKRVPQKEVTSTLCLKFMAASSKVERTTARNGGGKGGVSGVGGRMRKLSECAIQQHRAGNESGSLRSGGAAEKELRLRSSHIAVRRVWRPCHRPTSCGMYCNGSRKAEKVFNMYP